MNFDKFSFFLRISIVEDENMNVREKLIYLALKFNGDYQKIVDTISEEQFPLDDEELPPVHSEVLTFLDEDYPEEFKQHARAPLVLFYKGDISLIKDRKNNLAIIGTRHPTQYGLDATEKLVREVGKNIVIVSGLAKGIDRCAHECALKNNNKTVAVLGCGINVCYPSENKDLYEQIAKEGLIISEYPDLTPPKPEHFPFRNRLITMFSNALLITQAYTRSGTSITANWALEQGKNVLCVPHQLYHYSLCNDLIQCGAALVTSGQDVLEWMEVKKDEPIFEN